MGYAVAIRGTRRPAPLLPEGGVLAIFRNRPVAAAQGVRGRRLDNRRGDRARLLD